MDVLLGKVTQQAVNFAIRSGVTLTANYAIRQSNRLLKSVPRSTARDEFQEVLQRFERKVRIVSPAIDMIELIAARGNTSLESAVSLTKDLRYEIQSIGQRLAKIAQASEELRNQESRGKNISNEHLEAEMQLITLETKKLLSRIEDAVPLINLAITTSGARLSTKLPSTVSPSRLLQASTFLTAGDTQYFRMPDCAVQVGPIFNLTVYMLFAGHNRPETEEEIRETTWKEVIHKARVKLRRVPLDTILGPRSAKGRSFREDEPSDIPAEARSDEYAYHLMMVEDFDDDRLHDFDGEDPKPGPFDDVALAGIREIIPIHEISKIFYADTSKVLNIAPEAEVHHPVLLLKRDIHAIPPRRMMREDDAVESAEEQSDYISNHDINYDKSEVNSTKIDDPWRLPPSLDPEWIAFEVYNEEPSSDTEPDTDQNGENSDITSSLSALEIRSGTPNIASQHSLQQFQSSSTLNTVAPPPWTNHIQTTLSLLELLLRLTSLQQFQQASHLSISDELLNFFLEEAATTGAGGDEEHRQAIRAEARRRVGWDPYDESPLKRRGEDYQYQQYPHSYSPYSDIRYTGTQSREGTPLRNSNSNDIATSMNPGKSDSSRIWSPSALRSSITESEIVTPFNKTKLTPESARSPSAESRSRADRIRRQEKGREGTPRSPLQHRQQSPNRRSSGKDEGLGTSPASAGLGK